jgi:enoyl-CoA hydratase/carnithine racemase
MHEKIMPWFHSPKILDDQVEMGTWWETEFNAANVYYNESVYERVADAMRGAYFGLVCETLDAGLAELGDLEMAVSTALVVKPPFEMMNKMGVDKALELVKAYAEEWPGFKVPGVLVKQAESGEPWNIPMVYRQDEDDIAVVTIKRPGALNALSQPIMRQLKSTFEDIKNDDAIKGAVLTGFGVKAFVSGADINEIAMMRSPEELHEFAARGQGVLNFIESLGKPVVCAMNGLAFGGGNELAMACTARIARKGSRVLAGQPEPKLGIVPGYGGTQRLPRWIGLTAAWPILRTGNPISSEDALKLGLIQAEVEGDIKEAGIEFVKKLIAGEIAVPAIPRDPIEVPESLPDVDIGHLSRKIDEIMQKAILEGAKMTLEEGLKYEAEILGECVTTKDMRIGMETFMKFGPKKNAGFSHS